MPMHRYSLSSRQNKILPQNFKRQNIPFGDTFADKARSFCIELVNAPSRWSIIKKCFRRASKSQVRSKSRRNGSIVPNSTQESSFVILDKSIDAPRTVRKTRRFHWHRIFVWPPDNENFLPKNLALPTDASENLMKHDKHTRCRWKRPDSIHSCTPS